MSTFREPEPRRGHAGRWFAFAIAVFFTFAGAGSFTAFATGGRLDLSAVGIGGTARAGVLETPSVSSPSSLAPTTAPATAAAAATPSAPTSDASGQPGGSAHPNASPGGLAVAGKVDPKLAAKLQRALETARKKLLLPGVSATVILPDGATWTGVSGYAVPSKKVLVRPETPFALASVTKTFTAALILRLAEKGRLRLDDRLSKYVPGYPDASKITITMLLRQTSGLQDYFQDPRVDIALNKARRKVWTPQTVLAFDKMYFQTVVFPPGKGWHYSNTNYLLLGLVAQKAGGATWETLLHREILDPLGLKAITIQGSDQPAAAPAHGNAMFTGSNGRLLPRDLTDGSVIVPFTSVVTAAWSAGALASDSRDLAAWARALYGGNVLSPASKRMMLTFDPKIARAYATAYGMGVSKVRFDGRIAYGHTGALAGSRSAIRWLPKERVAIAALFNRDGLLRGDDVVRFLVTALFPKPAASPTPPAAH